MRRIALALALAVALLPFASSSALACSAGNWDRRAETDVFVLGRVVSVELRPFVQPVPSKGGGPLFHKVVTMQVDLVLKGPPAETVTFVDAGYAAEHLDRNTGRRVRTWGGGGDCSAIEEDPTGKYGAFALSWADDGTLHSSILLGSALGSDARDPAIMRLIESHGLSLPSTSTAPPTAPPTAPLGLVVGVAGLGILVIVLLRASHIARRRSRSARWPTRAMRRS